MLMRTKFIVKAELVILLHYMVMQYTLATDDCANYSLPNHDVDQYRIFAMKCKGSEELGFKGRSVFHARFLKEDDFNKLFERVKKTHFEIRIEASGFTNISMPMLTEAIRPKPNRSRLFIIRGNGSLKKLSIPQSKFDVQEPFHVEIDSNPQLEDGVLNRFQTNCLLGMRRECDIFAATDFCAALEDEEDILNCAGAAIIKQAPGITLLFDAGRISEKEFNQIFDQATHVQMCIILKRSDYKTLRMPKLKRLFPCKKQRSSLVIANNSLLEEVTLGKEALVVNMQVEYNSVLPNSMINALSRACNNKNLGFCKIEGTGIEGGVDIDQNATQGVGLESGVDIDQNATQETMPFTSTYATPTPSGSFITSGLGGGNDEDYSGGFFGGPPHIAMKSKDKDKKEKKGNCRRCLHTWFLPLLSIALFVSGV